MPRREKKRDDRDFDLTQLREGGSGHAMGRDYSAHFWRWSFARRFIKKTDHVLEIGCGQDKPLSKLLIMGAAPRVDTYTGVDLNKLKPTKNQRLTFHGEFNFVDRYKELLQARPEGFDVLVHLEVIEHMHVKHGVKFLKACFQCVKPGGHMLMSTPCYDGVHHAANHIHEYGVEELQKATEKAGFEVVDRFGTFMNIKEIGKGKLTVRGDVNDEAEIQNAVIMLKRQLGEYYDNEALSCLFAPLYPDAARNNLWVCRRPE